MKAIKVVLCFLNRLDFIEKLNDDVVEKLRCVKKQLVIEFGECNMATMIYATDIIGEKVVLIITNEINDLLEKNNCY